ncbi:hypothetical protein CsSME_00020113 [Camellia sinensis var. sinensis]
MDLPSLCVILQSALSPNPDELKAAEHSLNQFQYTPQHLVRLLQIIVDENCDMAVRQVASIHFKNFIAKNWSPHEPRILGLTRFIMCVFVSVLNCCFSNVYFMHLLVHIDEQSKILPNDKDMIRQNILVFIAQVPPLLRFDVLAIDLFAFLVALRWYNSHFVFCFLTEYSWVSASRPLSIQITRSNGRVFYSG